MLLIVPHTNNKKKIITYFLIFKAFLKVLVTATLFYKIFNNIKPIHNLDIKTKLILHYQSKDKVVYQTKFPHY